MNTVPHRHPRSMGLPVLLCSLLLLGACTTSTKRLDLETAFPVPLITKVPVNMGIHLNTELTGHTYLETVEKKGSWEVMLGPVQRELFDTLARGVFQNHRFVETIGPSSEVDGFLEPAIAEVQFALPSQTRSDYYEVWIRYDFSLYDQAGNLIGHWKLPAYGKANQNNFGSKSAGLQAAAIAACRDAMAFFSINFSREPFIAQWLLAGMPAMAPTDANIDASGAQGVMPNQPEAALATDQESRTP